MIFKKTNQRKKGKGKKFEKWAPIIMPPQFLWAPGMSTSAALGVILMFKDVDIPLLS